MNHHPFDPYLSSSAGEGYEWRTAFLFSCVLPLIVLNALHQYLGAGRDDVFITLWAGKTLGVGPWFINYNGEAQEISSSLLGALIAKFAYWCCADTYYLANKLFGGAAALATLLAVWFNRRLFFRHLPDCSAIATIALLGFNSSFAYWGLGGLETPYYALFVLLYTAAAIRVFDSAAAATVTLSDSLLLALTQMLAILCRPEGFWLIGMTLVLTGLYWPALPARRLPILKAAILPPLLFLIALFAIRHAMTGVIFPNPVYAKVSIGHLGGFTEGWNYLTRFYTLGPIGVLLAATVLFSIALTGYSVLHRLPPYRKFPAPDSRFLVPALLICAYETFIVIVKGDWMEYHRFLVPTLALKMLLLVMLGEKLLALTPPSYRRPASFAAAILLVLVVAGEWRYRAPQDCSTRLTLDFFTKFLDHPNDATIGLNCAHQRDGYAIRPFIDQELSKYLAQQGHLTIVTYQGGYFPYFLRERFSPREITLVDTTGLLNLEIAKVEGEKIPTGNKYLDDIPAILGGEVPGLSERVLRYRPNMIYMLADSEAGQAKLKAIGFERIHQAPGGVVYLKTDAPTHSPHDPNHSR
ncbi:MAG: hypothetical protein P9F19_12200 [Candidatus Contendobacter sp.]|nr:hypothetical protein [Candidatus Contendobacter sp.]MDG4558130.1 hypothetical protein [Candidatus Contendobacter sp.]